MAAALHHQQSIHEHSTVYVMTSTRSAEASREDEVCQNSGTGVGQSGRNMFTE
ncbi:hypothetical protein SK128_000840, partial [Halocaridina rubra]